MNLDKSISLETMRRLSADIRIETIQALSDAGFGHIGGAMSIADVLGVLYGGVMNVRPSEPDWEDRDVLVLSKGHSGPALYATLALCGYFPKDWLKTINKPKTNLPSHCDRLKTPGVDMSTGSLGQGISMAVGLALAARMQGKDKWTYCIVGDGEAQEGQVWEAAQSAASLGLDRLIIFVDYNKIQLDGALTDICTPYDLVEKFTSFGLNAISVKGYDVEDIYNGIQMAKDSKKPSVIVLDTYKGIGCSFAEGVFNHYMYINPDMAKEAINEIERRYAQKTYPGGDFKWLS